MKVNVESSLEMEGENCRETPFNHSKVLVVVYSDVEMTILEWANVLRF